MPGTVSVITAAIGRKELRQCIESVQAQTYEARHYVYVNGAEYHDASRVVLKDFPDVHANYLTDVTGYIGNSGSMAGIFAAAPFLTSSDWVVFLDDDNWLDPNHVQSLVDLAESNDLKWAYSLRRFVTVDGKPICDDDWCSLGHIPGIKADAPVLVDTSCYLVDRKLACRVGQAWTVAPMLGDRGFYMALHASGHRFGCTGLSTVNYRIGLNTATDTPEELLERAKQAQETFPGGFPWRKPTIYV